MTYAKPPSPKALRMRRARESSAEALKQNLIVKKRSEGQCEARFVETWDCVELLCGSGKYYGSTISGYTERRCPCRATEIHHMQKPRKFHESAEQKQHLCTACHRGVTGGVGGRLLIVVQQGPEPNYRDPYIKVRREASHG